MANIYAKSLTFPGLNNTYLFDQLFNGAGTELVPGDCVNATKEPGKYVCYETSAASELLGDVPFNNEFTLIVMDGAITSADEVKHQFAFDPYYGTILYRIYDGYEWTEWSDLTALSGGRKLSANDDLNDCTAPGRYISGSSSTSNTLTNSPITDMGFLLITVDGYIPGRVHQFILSNTRAMYHRQYQGSSWTSWGIIMESILSGDTYGSSLPTTDLTEGRIFFKLT